MAQAYLGDLREAPEPDGPWRHVTVLRGTLAGGTLSWVIPTGVSASLRYIRIDNMRPDDGPIEAKDERE